MRSLHGRIVVGLWLAARVLWRGRDDGGLVEGGRIPVASA